MQVTETLNESLKREYRIVLPAADIAEKVTARLEDLKGQVSLPGFRPGKVPMSMLRKRFGRGVYGEVLDQAIQDAVEDVMDDNGLKPAAQPKIDFAGELQEDKDVDFTLAMEVLPEIGDPDFSTISLEREVATVPEDKVTEALDMLRKQATTDEPLEEDRPSAKGDVVFIDFVGKLDGEPFEGGTAEDHRLELGSGALIPGFEEQLEGFRPGDETVVTVTFPEDYPAEHLAGKETTFDVEIKDLRRPALPELSDDLAKRYGKETAEELAEWIRGDLQGEFDEASRLKVKRKLLDALSEVVDFPVPEVLVTQEFNGIWQQLEQARESGNLDAEDAAKSEEDLRAEYQGIAERRVRLGLLLAEMGQRNKISVTQEDMNKALFREIRNYPGQEMQVLQFFRENKEAMERLKAPIFEDKVCDFILELAQVTDVPVAPEALMADPDEDGAGSADADGAAEGESQTA